MIVTRDIGAPPQGGPPMRAGGARMDQPIRQPEEILAYRSLQRILAAKPPALWSVAPTDTVRAALQIMADKDTGLVVVLEQGRLAGVLSERDCARRVLLAGKPADTAVSEIMVRNVVTVEVSHTFADCLRLMHKHRIRHLVVTDKGSPHAVVSIRDLLNESVHHHAKIIAELERERLTMFTSTV
jgi:signal-transduction protein with cAMP-binding, CBS, and nucleotidyltransferase domain